MYDYDSHYFYLARFLFPANPADNKSSTDSFFLAADPFLRTTGFLLVEAALASWAFFCSALAATLA